MDTVKMCKLDVERYRRAVLEKLTVVTGGKIDDTGYHLRIVGGQYDCAEVELVLEKFGYGYAALLDGKRARCITTDSNENVWTLVGAIMERLETKKQHLERIRKQRDDNDQCLLLLKNFTLPEGRKCRCNVDAGKAHLEIRASFGPERIKAFMDMVEMAQLTLEDGDVAIPGEDDAEGMVGTEKRQ